MADAPVFEDILYEKRDNRAAWIIVNRPKLYHAFRAQTMMEMGLVNKVVPAAELDAAVKAWTDIPAECSPTALALAKRSFSDDSENIRGVSLAMLNAVKLFYETEKSKEGVRTFKDRRKPDFHAFVK